MSLSINKLSSTQLTTDRQRARATEFINRNDREVTEMASRAHDISHRSDNQRFSKNLKTALYSLPVVAVASGLALKKGIKPSLKNGADWGVALAAPAAVSAVSKALSKPDSHGRKHDNLPFGAHLVFSLGTYFAGFTAIEAASKNKKVNEIADAVIKGAKDTYRDVKSKISIPEKMTNAFNSVKSKIKVPEFAKPFADKVMASETMELALKTSKDLGKKVLQHAPLLVAAGTVVAVVGSAVRQASEISGLRSNIKRAQLDTARNLVNSYQTENQNLKAENSKLEEFLMPADEA